MSAKPWNVLGWLAVALLAFALCVGLGSCLLCSQVAIESVEEFDRITASPSSMAVPESDGVRSDGPPTGHRPRNR